MFKTTIDRLNSLQPYLKERIRGQDHIIAKVCSLVERAELDLRPPGKPKGSLLFLGPTGVGKTELTLELARFLFGDSGAVFRFDMSEFYHDDSVKLFTGDESGQTGRLGKVLAERKVGIFLFDEVEKANRLIWDLFLQMTDAARITLADHRTHDLSGFYLIFTSNIGSQNLLRHTRLPFATVQRAVLAELSQVFRPEMIARFDETLVFRPLGYEVQRQIAQMAIDTELSRFRDRGMALEVTDSALEFLIRHGIHKTLGARNMKKTVQRFLGEAVAALLKTGSTTPFGGQLQPSSDGQFLQIRSECLLRGA